MTARTGPPPSLDDLRIFALIVEHLSFSHVAKILGVAQSTIGRRMAELEFVLDARLLRADTRRITITNLGMEIYPHCARMVEAANAACAGVAAARGKHPKGYFVSSAVDNGTLPVTAHQVRQILREELGKLGRGSAETVTGDA